MTSVPKILLVEDDVRLAHMVSDYLRANGLGVLHVTDGASALTALARSPVDAVLLDLMLPDVDGLDLFRQIRASPLGAASVPVIMLTARGDPMDRVIGLEIGAEDYISKPFEPRELLARIRVVLRRASGGGAASSILRFGRLEIDRGARAVRLDNELQPLTSYQFDLLAAMAERSGRVLTREQIAELAGRHGSYDPSLDRSVDVHIARIRAAIEDDHKSPRRILTVRGVGYVFAKAQDLMRRLYLRIYVAMLGSLALFALLVGLASIGLQEFRDPDAGYGRQRAHSRCRQSFAPVGSGSSGLAAGAGVLAHANEVRPCSDFGRGRGYRQSRDGAGGRSSGVRSGRR